MLIVRSPRSHTRTTPSEARRKALRRAFPDARERPRFLAARLLRAGEVAALLQVSRRSVAVWANRGLIPFIETPGGHRRFRAADVRALIERTQREVEQKFGVLLEPEVKLIGRWGEYLNPE